MYPSSAANGNYYVLDVTCIYINSDVCRQKFAETLKFSNFGIAEEKI